MLGRALDRERVRCWASCGSSPCNNTQLLTGCLRRAATDASRYELNLYSLGCSFSPCSAVDCTANAQVGTIGSLFFWPTPACVASNPLSNLTGLRQHSALARAWLVRFPSGVWRRHWSFVFSHACSPPAQNAPFQFWKVQYYLGHGSASQAEADGTLVSATAIPPCGRPLGFKTSFGYPSCDLFGDTARYPVRTLRFRCPFTRIACQSDVLGEISRPPFLTICWGGLVALFLDSGDWVAPALAFLFLSLLRPLVRPLHLHRHSTGRAGARLLSFGSYHAPAAFGKIVAPSTPLLWWTPEGQQPAVLAPVGCGEVCPPCDRLWSWLVGRQHPATLQCPGRNGVSTAPRMHRVPEDLSAAFDEAVALEDDPQELPREDNPGGWLRPAPLDEDGDEEVVVAVRRPGPPPTPTPATFAILVVDAVLERVEVVLECPSTVAQAKQLIDDARDHDRSLLYPHLVEVVPQPCETWGTFLAVPAWCDNEALIVFDLTDFDGRFFVDSVPWVANRAQLFSIAGVDLSPNILIYAFGHPAPLDDEDLHVYMGGCIFFVPRWLPARIGYGLPWMLRTPRIWNQAAVLPLSLEGRFLCCVLDGGHRCFEIRPDRGNYVRQDIPAEFGLNQAQVTYQVSHPEVDDAAIKGRTCLAVLGVTTEIWRTAQLVGSSDGASALALVDCRPLLQGWMSIVVEGGTYSHSELVDHLSVFAPAGWQVQVDGAPVENGDFQLDRGRLLQAQFVPLTTDEEMDDGTEDCPDGTSDSDADSSDSSDSSSQGDGSDAEGPCRDCANPGDHSGGGSTQSRSRSPSRAPREAFQAVPHIGGCSEIMWCKRFLQHVCRPDSVWITSDFRCYEQHSFLPQPPLGLRGNWTDMVDWRCHCACSVCARCFPTQASLPDFFLLLWSE